MNSSDGTESQLVDDSADSQRRLEPDELLVEKAHFEELFQASPDAVVLVNSEGRVLRANRYFTSLFGYETDEVIGQDVEDMLAPDHLLEEAQSLTERVLTGERVDVETVRRCKDGSLVSVSIVGAPILDGEEPVDVYAIYRDISERKRAEEVLLASEARFRDLYNNAPDMYFTSATDTACILECNETVLQTLGYSREEVIGHHLAEFYHPDNWHEFEEAFATFQRTGEVHYPDHRVVRKDGTTIYVSLNASAVRDDQGKIIRARSVWRNVTERRLAEQALRTSEQRYRDLVENATYGIYRSSRESRFESANPALIEMLGYDSEAELLALEMATDVYVDPEERSRLIKYYQQAEHRVALDEVEWKRRDGSRITVRLGGRLVRNEAGELQAFEMFVEDVTTKRALETQLRQAQKMEAVGRLAGGVAHDFNNILTVIVGESEMALADLPEDAPVREGLKEIRLAADRATALTRQLLTFSRRQIVEPTVFNLNGLVRDMDNMLRRLIGEDVELVTRTAPDLGNVETDRGQIEQVVVNLVVNARDAMPEGGKLVIETANVTLDETYNMSHPEVSVGDYVALSVSDSGTGMSEETMTHLFEPFFTTKEKGQGTGLGLATSYGIVKQSGGHITAYSELGVGTTMKVYLPLVAARTGHTGEFEVAAAPRGTETVLLVEDEERVLAVGKRILEGQGYTVLEAANAEEALQLMENYSRPLHLLLTDVVLPKMDGRLLAKRVKELRPDVKVLFTSGYTEDVVLKHRLLAGDVALLQKPFTRESLARKVREVLDAGSEHERS